MKRESSRSTGPWPARLALALGAWGGALAAAGFAQPKLDLDGQLRAPFPVALHRLVDGNGDGKVELVLIAEDGRVAAFGARDGARTLTRIEGEEWSLPGPDRCLVAFGDVLSRGVGAQMIVCSPDGTRVHRFTAKGAVAKEGRLVSSRARFDLRVGSPTLAPFVQDVNEDGRLDLVLPGRDTCELWMQRDKEGGAVSAGSPGLGAGAGDPGPSFRRAARVNVAASLVRQSTVSSLSSVLRGGFTIPDLETADVNGDGRKDLLVSEEQTRAFHLQREDGSLPVEPDVKVDLRIFRDTTPARDPGPGDIAGLGEARRFETKDLDGDSIPDYVIAHRRKIWFFHGTKEGPRFTRPSFMLKSAEDFTGLALVDLSEDDRPDLLLFKFRIPSIATLVLGMVSRWSVEISPVGLANLDGRKFESTPRWKRTIAIEIPPLLDIMRDPESLLSMMEDAQNRFRQEVLGDLDGDGQEDLALLSTGQDRLDVWRGKAGRDFTADPDVSAGRFLFDEGKSKWKLEELFEWFGALAEEQVLAVTRGDDPDGSFSLAKAGDLDLISIECADLSGDGRGEIVLCYEATGSPGDRRFEVYTLRE